MKNSQDRIPKGHRCFATPLSSVYDPHHHNWVMLLKHILNLFTISDELSFTLNP